MRDRKLIFGTLNQRVKAVLDVFLPENGECSALFLDRSLPLVLCRLGKANVASCQRDDKLKAAHHRPDSH